MFENRFSTKEKCKDLESIHKKVQFKTPKRRFHKLDEIAGKLQSLFPDILIQPGDQVCDYCNDRLLKMIAESKAALSKTTEISHSSGSAVGSSQSLSSNNDSDPLYVHKTNSEDISSFNEILGLYSSAVSPLQGVDEVDLRCRVNYAARKRKEISQMQDSELSTKIRKLYDISDDIKLDLPTSGSSKCNSCASWFKSFSKSFDNCSSVAEKIRLLSAAPVRQLSMNQMLSKWSNVSSYMIGKARKVVNEKGNYCSPDPHIGHPIEKNIQKGVLEYFLNDDFNCSTQSPNKNDIIYVKENGEKIAKLKRYMSRSIHETYQMFKNDNPDMKIGHSKFYSLRPKWVLQSPTQQVCLCIYCTNFELLLVGLKNCSKKCGMEIENERDIVLSAAVCEVDNDLCIFKECKDCPGVNGVIQTLRELFKEEIEEEITFAFWESNDLIKKTASIEIFIKKLAEWTLKVNTHLRYRELQQKGIRKEKEFSKQNLSHLILHIDFAENWSVIVSNEVQSYHWKSKQVSIFTAVCYIGLKTESYVVVSDDLCHDSAHALLAMDTVVNDLSQRFPEFTVENITIISDGAPSHFKNRYQLYELRKSTMNKKWIFSATGHGKGACDGIGGLVKHFATRHNLTQEPISYIQCAKTFVEKVETKTPKIRHLFLDKEELGLFRGEKLNIWGNVQSYKGIRQTHVWKNDIENSKVYTARTCEHEWKLIG